MNATESIDATIPIEIKAHVHRLEQLWALLEDPPEGVDVAANVAAYVAESDQDVALAIAIYLKDSLEPALTVGRKARARILDAVQRNEKEREWLRRTLGQLLDRLKLERIKGPTITVTRTASASKRAVMKAGADVELLPERFLAPREPATGAIRDALLAGEAVEGWELVDEPGVMLR